MDIKMHRNTLFLIRKIFSRKVTTEPYLETVPQKPSFNSAEQVMQPFKRTAPEEQGISSEYIDSYLTELKNDKTLDLHSIMIIKNGCVISEMSFGAYSAKYWHVTHSECKSITGLAIGMLIDEGKLKLSDEINKIFEKRSISISHLTHKSVTVRDLLTMTSGILFNEAGAVTENDWVKCFLQSAIKTEPGEHFNYNSMNTYMLSAIVKQVSGQGLTDYLNDRLFKPMGITQVFWETCPKGIEKGGWGLYIRIEDFAKIGQMVLDKGRWNGKQLISEDWIKEAISVKSVPPENIGDFNYGYQIWTGKKYKAFLFNGMFGQNIIGFEKTGVLISVNSGNSEMFQQSKFFSITEKYFSEHNMNENIKKEHNVHESSNDSNILFKKIIKFVNAFFKNKDESIPAVCYELNGKEFVTQNENSVSVGLLPLLVQIVQNNYSKGFKSIIFNVIDNEFYITVYEADEVYKFPVGFNEVKYIELNFHGEPYFVGSLGKFSKNEDDIWVLSIRVSFPEIANSRVIKVYLYGNEIKIKMNEIPGKDFIYKAMDSFITQIKTKPLVDGLINKVDGDYIDYKITTAFEPEISAELKNIN